MTNENTIIDEDGEELVTKPKAILKRLETATKVTGWILDECGNRDIDMDIFDWDSTANNDQDIPDIVIQGNRGTIFFDELDNAKLFGDTLTIGNRYEIHIK